MVNNIGILLSSVLTWLNTIITSFMENDTLRTIILIPICGTLIFIVIGIFKSFFSK